MESSETTRRDETSAPTTEERHRLTDPCVCVIPTTATARRRRFEERVARQAEQHEQARTEKQQFKAEFLRRKAEAVAKAQRERLDAARRRPMRVRPAALETLTGQLAAKMSEATEQLRHQLEARRPTRAHENVRREA